MGEWCEDESPAASAEQDENTGEETLLTSIGEAEGWGGV